MQLNAWQRAVARTYANGDFDYFETIGEITRADLSQCGDTLFVFLMIELSDAEDCDSAEEAVRRIENAHRQLGDAVNALQALAPAVS